jgi:nicotinamidase-related amidase
MSSFTEQRRDRFTELHADERLALVTIDCQHDWIDPEGLYYIEPAEEIVPRVARLVDTARASSSPIFHVLRLYLEGGANADLCRRQDLLSAGGRCCVPGTEGAELIADLKPDPDVRLDSALVLSGHPQVVGPNERIFYKPRFGAFSQASLERHLRAEGIDSLIFCGISFPRCVLASIFGAVDHDFRVGVVPEATSEVGEMELAFLEGAGVQGLTLDSALEHLSGAVAAR